LKGVVKDEGGKPLGDATVTLTVEVTNGHFETQAIQEVTTDANGSYSFNQIVNLLPYSLVVHKPGYSSATMHLRPNSELKKGARQNFTFQPGRASNPSKMWVTGYPPDTAPGETSTPQPDSLDIRLPYRRRVTIDYEFQVENRFIGNGAIKRAVLEEGGNFQFEAGSFGRSFEKPGDMTLKNWGGTPMHRHFYVGQFAGHYDLGEVDFESVKALDLGKLTIDDTECRINHTYGLRTEDGKHVKFIVRNIEVIEPQ
jgi:hypothetical protein